MYALRAVANVSAMRAVSDISAIACAAAFLLLLATAISDYLRWIATTAGAPNWIEFFGPFALLAVPLAMALVLLAARSRAVSMVVASLSTLFYLAGWATLGL